MKKIKGVTIFADELMFFAVGGNLMQDGKETNVSVEKVSVWFGTARVYMSNGEVLIFRGFPLRISV